MLVALQQRPGRPRRVGRAPRRGRVLLHDVGQVEARRLGELLRLGRRRLQEVDAAHGLGERVQAKLLEAAADVVGDELKVRDDVSRLAARARAQRLLLRRHADGAVVRVADSSHDAAGGDHGHRPEAEFLGAQQRQRDDVAARADAAVDAQRDAAAQAVLDEGAVRLGEAELEGRAGVLDGREGGGARATVVARNLDYVCARLCAAAGDGADSRDGDELDGDARGWVDGL
mmetsp:Transcript_22259/g.77142  ORF Transcript_22259/g.77142 Transcript_22259/m.77142 type:complete len:230 (-) Transcript_22259:3245-3934(-)